MLFARGAFMDALLRAISVCTYGRIQLIIHNGLRRVPVSIILDQQALPRCLRAFGLGTVFGRLARLRWGDRA
jgi:hypothetical protein